MARKIKKDIKSEESDGFLELNSNGTGRAQRVEQGGMESTATAPAAAPATSFSSKLPEMLACSSVMTFHLSLGLVFAYSAVLLPQLEAENSDIAITKHQASWLASVVALAVPLGSFCTGPIMEAIGRLRSVQAAALPFWVGCVLISTASGFPALLAGRFLTGLAAGTLGTNPAIVYTTEVARPELRGSLISLGPFMVSLATLSMYVLGSFLDWRTLSWIMFCTPLLPVVAIQTLCTESPVWLVAKQRRDEAVRSLQFLNRRDPVKLARAERDVEDMMVAAEARRAAQRSGLSGYLATIFVHRSGLRPMIVIVTLFALQQFCGVYVCLFYAVNFFQDAGSAMNPYTASMIVGGIRVACSVQATLLMRRYGRRPLLMISSIGAAASLFVSGYFVRVANIEPGAGNWTAGNLSELPEEALTGQPAYVRWVPVGAILVFVYCGMLGLLTIPWTMTAELFPPRIRGLAQGVSVAFANFFMFLAVQSYRDLVAVLGGVYAAHWFYAAVSLLCAVFVYLFLPETHRRTLTEIEDYFATSLVYPCYQRRRRRALPNGTGAVVHSNGNAETIRDADANGPTSGLLPK